MWVAVDSGLPVLIEVNTVGDDGTLEVHSVQDNFQWNIELDAAEFKPDIPEDYKQIEEDDSQDGVGTGNRKWRCIGRHPDGDYNLESEDGQAGATIPASWADSPEQAVRVKEELDLLKQQGNRELVGIMETEVNGQLDSRILMYEYNLSDGQTVKIPDFEPDDPSQWTLIGERQTELSQLRKEGKGQELTSTEERQVDGRDFIFEKQRFVLSDGTEVVRSIGRLKED